MSAVGWTMSSVGFSVGSHTHCLLILGFSAKLESVQGQYEQYRGTLLESVSEETLVRKTFTCVDSPTLSPTFTWIP